jgi:hypothetical protein
MRLTLGAQIAPRNHSIAVKPALKSESVQFQALARWNL